jgi:hypothetical protein
VYFTAILNSKNAAATLKPTYWVRPIAYSMPDATNKRTEVNKSVLYEFMGTAFNQ